MNQQQFISECGKSYPEVMAALAHFRHSVQRECQPVVQKRLKHLADVLGISQQNLRLGKYAWPDKPALAHDDELLVGWQAKRAEDIYLNFYLYWDWKGDRDTTSMGACISIWINDTQKRIALATSLRDHRANTVFKDQARRLEDRRFRIEMQDSEILQIATKLDNLFAYTVGFLKTVDGVQDHFRV